jgi:signal recognition particle subunit SEC65
MQDIGKDSRCLYPLNLDATVSREAGRLCAKEHSPNAPTFQELEEAMQLSRIPFAVEQTKRHPQDYFRFGRVRFYFKDPSGKWFNPELQNKSQLANFLGKAILSGVRKGAPDAPKAQKGRK